jgi:hypothetical protein
MGVNLFLKKITFDLSLETDYKFLVDASFLWNKALVPAALLRETVKWTACYEDDRIKVMVHF